MGMFPTFIPPHHRNSESANDRQQKKGGQKQVDYSLLHHLADQGSAKTQLQQPILIEAQRMEQETGPRCSFSKPYAAKTVFFYKDKDQYFTGLRLPISRAKFRTMDALLDTLNKGISLPFGVRRVHTSFGRTEINSVEQLEHLGSHRYVASSSTPCRQPPTIHVIEKRQLQLQKQLRVNNQYHRSTLPPHLIGRTPPLQTNSSIGSSSPKHRVINPAFLPVQAKQIFFVLNGYHSRIYRALINPHKVQQRHLRRQQLLGRTSPTGNSPVGSKDRNNKRGEMDSLLEEISNGLQTAIFRIYSFDGERIHSMKQLLELKEPRVLAVPRNERPLLKNGHIYADLYPGARHGVMAALPPIRHNHSNTDSGGSTSNSNQKSSPHSSASSETQKTVLKSTAPSLVEDESRALQPVNAMGNCIEKPLGKRRRSSLRAVSRLPILASRFNAGQGGNGEKGELGDSSGDASATVVENSSLSDITPINEEEPSDAPPRLSPIKSSSTDQEKEPKKKKRKKRRAVKVAANGLERENLQNNPEQSNESSLESKSSEDGNIPEASSEDDYPYEPKGEPEELILLMGDGGQRSVTQVILRSGSVPILEGLPRHRENGQRRRATINGQLFVEELKYVGYADREGVVEFLMEEAGVVPSESTASAVSQRNSAATHLEKSASEEHAEIPRMDDKSDIFEHSLATSDIGETATKYEEERGELVIPLEPNLLPDSRAPPTPTSSIEAGEEGELVQYPYTITVITGNRWAADTEADLHITMFGVEKQSSRKIYLRQNHVNWLHTGMEHRFKQNQADSFRVELPIHLGIIERITVGHTHSGYGAGLFIDRILITEEEEQTLAAKDGSSAKSWQLESKSGAMHSHGPKQYLFLCSMWFDSGQVDGKLERTLHLSAYAELNPPPPLTPSNVSDAGLEQEAAEPTTIGRWELLVHTGKLGYKGSTSTLAIVGYGTKGQSKTINLYDKRMSEEGENDALLQVDFGDIGELLKTRFEIDGAGASPNLFLRSVDYKDLDTGERFTSVRNAWLKWEGTKRGDQPFRELIAFHLGVEPTTMIHYEGRMSVTESSLKTLANPLIQLEFFGDLGETGLLPIRLQSAEHVSKMAGARGVNSKHIAATEEIEIDFHLEAASVGRVYGARLYFLPTVIGEEVYAGLAMLSGLLIKHSLEVPNSTRALLVNRMVLRESLHAPYRYLLEYSRLGNDDDNSDNPPLTADADGEGDSVTPIFVKELLTSEMEGVSTRLRKRRIKPKNSTFILSMSISHNSTHYPDVTLCDSKGGAAMMNILSPTPKDGIISYQLKSPTIGELHKVRVGANEDNKLLRGSSSENEVDPNEEEVAANSLVRIYKIRVCETANGDELRFSDVNLELGLDSTYELSSIWPDCPPVPLVSYRIQVPALHRVSSTWSSRGAGVRLLVNIYGEKGDTGFRLLSNSFELDTKESGSSKEYGLEAISIGKLSKLRVKTEGLTSGTSFEIGEIVVSDPEASRTYTFEFRQLFTPSSNCHTANSRSR